MRPIPMPALNIIAIQETVRNSGSSSSLPSGMVPKRPAASQITKATNAEATVTNSQPMFVTVQDSASEDAEPRLRVSAKPQTRKPTARAAVTPKTTLSTLPLVGLASSVTGCSRAGCGMLDGSRSAWVEMSRAMAVLLPKPVQTANVTFLTHAHRLGSRLVSSTSRRAPSGGSVEDLLAAGPLRAAAARQTPPTAARLGVRPERRHTPHPGAPPGA